MTEIKGILNGTTNFILSKMTEEGADFGDTLALAQSIGFAGSGSDGLMWKGTMSPGSSRFSHRWPMKALFAMKMYINGGLLTFGLPILR